MNLLMLNDHLSQEYDDFRLFQELGFNVFSALGALVDPEDPQPAHWRGPLPQPEVDFEQERKDSVYARRGHPPSQYPPDLSAAFFEKFDAILINFWPNWVEKYWELIKDKVVVWRSSGQSTPEIEAQLRPYQEQGMKIVRCSPIELELPGNIGADAVIRCHLYPDDWKNWVGKSEQVLTVAANMLDRPDYELWDLATRRYPRTLIGPGNRKLGVAAWLPFEKIQQAYRLSRVCFVPSSRPAPYNNTFREAWMTGIPVITPGPEIGGDTYEVPQLIQHGVDAFWVDSFVEGADIISSLMDDHKLAENIGRRGRAKALEIFGKDPIKEQWRSFLLPTL